jgi:biopolymer transport protein ExbD
MLAQPLLQRSIDVQIPLENDTDTALDVPPIVLEIDAGGGYRINNQPVPGGQLEAQLREIYQGRPDKLLFVKAGSRVIYQDVITAMDAARGAGVEVLGAVIGQ